MGCPFTFMTLDPAHFHAALVHKETHPNVSPVVHVYAPIGWDLMAHLDRMTRFNTRAKNPTSWQLEVHAGPDFLDRMLEEKPGNVVILSGRNRQKIEYMLACVEAGLHVFADKPWIIKHEDFSRLERLVEMVLKKRNKSIVYDMMTERYEVANILLRDLVREPEIFGEPKADPSEPTLEMTSVHTLKKVVAGQPLLRPTAFFDIQDQGEGLADVGTHLADLAIWMLFPDQAIHWSEVEFVRCERFPTVLSTDEFQAVTGEAIIPPPLQQYVRDGKLQYFCNNRVHFRVRGKIVRLEVLWNLDASLASRDTHSAAVHGTLATARIRQSEEFGDLPALFIEPVALSLAEMHRRLSRWVENFPRLKIMGIGNEFRIDLPDTVPTHENHFAQMTAQFLRCVRMPGYLETWEMPNLLAKYYITTKGVELARTGKSGEHGAQASDK